MLGRKSYSGASKTKQLAPVHLDLPLFWKPHWATCVPACKGPISLVNHTLHGQSFSVNQPTPKLIQLGDSDRGETSASDSRFVLDLHLIGWESCDCFEYFVCVWNKITWLQVVGCGLGAEAGGREGGVTEWVSHLFTPRRSDQGCYDQPIKLPLVMVNGTWEHFILIIKLPSLFLFVVAHVLALFRHFRFCIFWEFGRVLCRCVSIVCQVISFWHSTMH